MMHVISVSPAASTELAIAALAVPALIGVIVRIVLCMLAASATRKALEDLAAGQADADAVRAHRLAVLRAILAALSVRGHGKTGEDGAQLVLPDQNSPRSPELLSRAADCPGVLVFATGGDEASAILVLARINQRRPSRVSRRLLALGRARRRAGGSSRRG